MNSTKLFNFGYLIENIKKSKTVIILAMLVVPFFTVLQLVNTKEHIYSIDTLSIVNTIFLYFIPFILAAELYGYVFKKASVDFIASKPISKKSIFFTNFIGGIAIILLIQIITFICTQLVLSFKPDIIHFSAMSWDIFIYFLIGYIFVFTVSSLAMSVSGNVMTQLAMTMLIIFLPAVSYVFIAAETRIIDIWPDLYTFTAPLYVLAKTATMFTPSIIKMIVLIIAYFTAGIMLFKKRKMEMAGESFMKDKAHIIVKTLTLAPFSFIIIDMEDIRTTCIMLGIMFIYWFVYDLITNKKIKLSKNILCFVIGVIAVMGIYKVALVAVDEVFSFKDFNPTMYIEDEKIYDEIEKIEANKIYYYITNEKEIRDTNRTFEGKYIIEKEELKYLKQINFSNTNPSWLRGTVTLKDGRTFNATVVVDEKKIDEYVNENNIDTANIDDSHKVAIKGLTRKQNKEIISMLKGRRLIEISNNKYGVRFLDRVNKIYDKTIILTATKYENKSIRGYVYEIPMDDEIVKYLDENNLLEYSESTYYEKEYEKDGIIYETIEAEDVPYDEYNETGPSEGVIIYD